MDERAKVLTHEEMNDVRGRMLSSGYKMIDLSEEFGVSRSVVAYALRGLTNSAGAKSIRAKVAELIDYNPWGNHGDA